MREMHIFGKIVPLTDPPGYEVQQHTLPHHELGRRQNGHYTLYGPEDLHRCVVCGENCCPACANGGSFYDQQRRYEWWTHTSDFHVNGKYIQRRCRGILEHFRSLPPDIGGGRPCTHGGYDRHVCCICSQPVCRMCGNDGHGFWACANNKLCWAFRNHAVEWTPIVPVNSPPILGPQVKTLFEEAELYCENAPPPELFAATWVKLDAKDAGRIVERQLVMYPDDKYRYERHMEKGSRLVAVNTIIDPAPITPDLFGNLPSRNGNIALRCQLCGGWVRRMRKAGR